MTDVQLAELIDAIKWSIHTAAFQLILVQLVLFYWGRKRG